jgi:hypothetical protein
MEKGETNSGDRRRVRILRIDVKGLCGLYDHTIELNRDERVTVLHGPNGVGKTAVLRMVHSLFSGGLDNIGRVPFDSLAISLESSLNPSPGILEVKRVASKSSVDGEEFDLKLSRLDQEWVSNFVVPDPPEESKPLADWMMDLRRRVGTHFIETQRLQHWRDDQFPELVTSVTQDSEDLARRISETMARFGRDGQALEQTFPQRLLKMGNGGTGVLGGDGLRLRMDRLDLRRDELKRLGLLEQVESHPIDPSDLERLELTEKKVLTLYVEDSEKKLDILKDLAARIQLFLTCVNEKFRHKEIKIDRDSGFVAHSADGKLLDLDQLSSGEQHELVLLYDLLFRVEADTLVLIDEPEISLHLAWQRQFLPELLEIVKVAKFDALVATHSPFIVGDRSDLMIPLSDEI